MANRLFIIYLIYGTDHLQSGIDKLLRVAKQLYPNREYAVVAVDNAASKSYTHFITDWLTMIDGDNSLREFSGLDRGFSWVCANLFPREKDIFIIANDTFHRSYGDSYLKDFNTRKTLKAVESGAAVGLVDAFPKPVELLKTRYISWIRSSFLIAKYRVICQLSPFTSAISDADFFSESAGTFFKQNANMSDNLKTYLQTWLFAEGGSEEFQESWHSKRPLTTETLKPMQMKAKCIFCEQLLSAKARKLGIPIFDTRSQRYSVESSL